jgi:hypothetical protein
MNPTVEAILRRVADINCVNPLYATGQLTFAADLLADLFESRDYVLPPVSERAQIAEAFAKVQRVIDLGMKRSYRRLYTILGVTPANLSEEAYARG